LLTTGTNLTEILNARWEDVDFEKGTLATSASFTGRVRLIPLNNEALKFVQKLPRYADVSRLFQRVLETGWPRWREWEIIRPKLGMPKLCIQNLCHTFAKSLMGTGVGQNEVRSIMGYYRVEHLKNLNAPNGVS